MGYSGSKLQWFLAITQKEFYRDNQTWVSIEVPYHTYFISFLENFEFNLETYLKKKDPEEMLRLCNDLVNIF